MVFASNNDGQNTYVVSYITIINGTQTIDTTKYFFSENFIIRESNPNGSLSLEIHKLDSCDNAEFTTHKNDKCSTEKYDTKPLKLIENQNLDDKLLGHKVMEVIYYATNQCSDPIAQQLELSSSYVYHKTYVLSQKAKILYNCKYSNHFPFTIHQKLPLVLTFEVSGSSSSINSDMIVSNTEYKIEERAIKIEQVKTSFNNIISDIENRHVIDLQGCI